MSRFAVKRTINYPWQHPKGGEVASETYLAYNRFIQGSPPYTSFEECWKEDIHDAELFPNADLAQAVIDAFNKTGDHNVPGGEVEMQVVPVKIAEMATR